jgi:tRNA 2-thiouridine synthesizing protein A
LAHAPVTVDSTDRAGDPGPEIVVDARGHRCPTPTLRLARAARSAAEGTVLRLIADDPLARIDVPHFAAGAGLELLGVETAGPTMTFTLRVSRAPQEGGGASSGNNAPPEGL